LARHCPASRNRLRSKTFFSILISAVSFWTLERDGVTLYHDSEEHVAALLCVLSISADIWRNVLSEYIERWTPDCRGVHDRISLLGEVYGQFSPHSVPLPADLPASPCPICRAERVEAAYARRSGDGQRPIVYGCCVRCGHGALLSGAAEPQVYSSPAYYTRRGADNVGYAAYARERSYRELRAARLFAWIEGQLGGMPKNLLEVGSGFGFTRHTAELQGTSTFGVDLNAYAVAAASELYGMKTYTGTVGQALAAGAVPPGAWQMVLYQFVLEHVSDVQTELAIAAEALAPAGHLALLAPSIEALEILAFGSSYRSFRSDHLHLYSWKSLETVLASAGLSVRAAKTECTVQLLAGFLSKEELASIDARKLGPDMVVLAEKCV
jgi:SAM-dependent methyltransferase